MPGNIRTLRAVMLQVYDKKRRCNELKSIDPPPYLSPSPPSHKQYSYSITYL